MWNAHGPCGFSLGFANYYASYVKGYAEIVAPLQDLLKVGKIEGKKGDRKSVV